MIESLPATISRFTEGYQNSYVPSFIYTVHPDGQNIEANSSDTFRNSRRKLMDSLLTGECIQKDMSQALALEHFVSLAFDEPLEGSGFKGVLTPQSLEKSEPGHKGVDLLITGQRNLVYLGIDVKLRRHRSKYDRDGYGWNRRLQSPYIYLSLGNFSANTNKGELSVRDWLGELAIPSIETNGRIPLLDQFRHYLFDRIERSLYGYWERLSEPKDYYCDFGMPPSKKQLKLLENKLRIMQSLFYELRQWD